MTGRTCQMLGLLGIVVGALGISTRSIGEPGAAQGEQVPTVLLVGALLFLVGTLIERLAPD